MKTTRPDRCNLSAKYCHSVGICEVIDDVDELLRSTAIPELSSDDHYCEVNEHKHENLVEELVCVLRYQRDMAISEWRLLQDEVRALQAIINN